MRRIMAGCLALAAGSMPALAWQVAPATAPGSQPVTVHRSTEEQQRLLDFLAVIEGQNTPVARRTGARELLRAGWSETPTRLAAILSGSNRPARIAVAAALAESPQLFDAAYVEPLVSMLTDNEAETRQAAAACMVAVRSQLIIPRLAALLNDAAAPATARLAAIDTLGRHTQRDAIAALAAVIESGDTALSSPALSAMERATAIDFADAAEAMRWWRANKDAPTEQWQQLQIERLVRQGTASAQRVRELEQRLTAALRDNLLRTPETERGAVLNAYLSDSSDVVRLAGLELVQAQLAEGKTLSPETVESVRGALKAPERNVRGAAVRAVASLRSAADGERFLQLLASERDAEVQLAILYGLGYIGEADAVVPLLGVLEQGAPAVSAEAVVALGRLAERGVLDAGSRETVAAALLAHYLTTTRDDATGRERLLRSMARVADMRFAAALVDAADAREPVVVRTAALRGMVALLDAARGDATVTQQPTSDASTPRGPTRVELADVIFAAVGDADVSIRRAAVEGLAQVGSTDAHLQALLARSSAGGEPDEGVRAAAWRGVMRIAVTRPANDILALVERLPENGSTRTQRAMELLQAAEKSLVSSGAAASREELGRVRCRIAQCAIEANLLGEALRAYAVGVRDLAAAKQPDAQLHAEAFASLALRCGKFDAATAATLSELGAAAPGESLWRAMRGELERNLTRENVDRAVEMIAALRAAPPAQLSTACRAELDKLAVEAAKLQGERDSERVRTALAALSANQRDEAARAAIATLGARAVPELREALRAQINATTASPEYERTLHDLLKTLLPQWAGFAPDASPAEKLRLLDLAAV